MSSTKVNLISFNQKTCAYFDDGRAAEIMRLTYIETNQQRQKIVSPNQQKKLTFETTKKGLLPHTFGTAVTFCDDCNACVPLRVNTDKFNVSKSQQKLLNRTHINFTLLNNDEVDSSSMYILYKKYMDARHLNLNSEMPNWNEGQFNQWFYETPFKLIATHENNIIGYSLIDKDKEKNSIILHYSIFDPDFSKASLGKQLWIATIIEAIDLDIQHIYVGPWAKDSPKLDYKKNHSGLETYVNKEWIDFNPEIHTQGPDYKALFKNKTLDF